VNSNISHNLYIL